MALFAGIINDIMVSPAKGMRRKEEELLQPVFELPMKMVIL